CTPTGIGSDNSTGDGGERPPIEGLTAIMVTPQSASLTVDNIGAPKTQAYQAMGSFSSGDPRGITTQGNWTTDNTAIRSVSAGGPFTTANRAGGSGTITAKSGSLSGTAGIEVVFQPAIKASDAPTNADTLLPPTATGSVVAGMSPTVVYPSDQ